MTNKKNGKFVTGAFQIMLGLIFLVAGAGKFLAAAWWSGNFSKWGYPDNFYQVIGIAEMLGAIAIFIPRWSRGAAIFLAVIMVSAVITHLSHTEIAESLRPAIYLFLLSGLIYLKQQDQTAS